MKINSPNVAKIIVELTDSDMSELDITYASLDYSNIETRRVIWTILDRARRELGRDIDPSGKLTIEVIPADDGGCVILFTVNDIPQNIKAIISENEQVFEFESIDNVIDFLSILKNDTLIGDLYEDTKGKFRLISPYDDRLLSKIKFGEFAQKKEGKFAAEITKEHWHLKASLLGRITK